MDLERNNWNLRFPAGVIVLLALPVLISGCASFHKSKRGNEKTFDELLVTIDGRDSKARADAVYALRKFKHRRDVKLIAGPLIFLLKDEDPKVRSNAAFVLGYLEYKKSAPQLIDLLEDNAPEVRSSAAWALGELKDHMAVTFLLKASKDAAPDVRQNAVWALKKLGVEKHTEKLTAALPNRTSNSLPEPDLSTSLKDVEDMTGINPLLADLKDKNPKIRLNAALALGCLEDKKAVKPLIVCLKDDCPQVRCGAAWALGHLDDRRAVEPLAVVLKDNSPEVRFKAAVSLGFFKDKRAVEPLLVCLDHKDREVRVVAVVLLGMLGDKQAVAPLQQSLREEIDPELKEKIKKALQDLKTSS